MTINKNYSLLILLLTNIFLTTSCANTATNTPILDLMTSAVIAESSTHRALIIEEIKEESGVSFSVIYTGDLDEIMLDENSDFRLLIEDYEFNLRKPFQIDEELKGIILESIQELDNPVEVAKEISQIEEVMMVEVKNNKKDKV